MSLMNRATLMLAAMVGVVQRAVHLVQPLPTPCGLLAIATA